MTHDAQSTSSELVSTAEVLRRTGATRRQVEYWCREGRIPGQPEWVGQGYRRDWTPEQVEIVRVAMSGEILTPVHLNRRHGLAPKKGRRTDIIARQKAWRRLAAMHSTDFERLYLEELEKERR